MTEEPILSYQDIGDAHEELERACKRESRNIRA